MSARSSAVAAIGKEPVAIGIAAQAAAEDLRDAEPRQLASREIIQIRLPAAARVGLERVRVVRRPRDELLANFRADFEHVLLDRGPEPREHAIRRDSPSRAARSREHRQPDRANRRELPRRACHRDRRTAPANSRPSARRRPDPAIARTKRPPSAARRAESPRRPSCREPDSATADRAAIASAVRNRCRFSLTACASSPTCAPRFKLA